MLEIFTIKIKKKYFFFLFYFKTPFNFLKNIKTYEKGKNVEQTRFRSVVAICSNPKTKLEKGKGQIG